MPPVLGGFRIRVRITLFRARAFARLWRGLGLAPVSWLREQLRKPAFRVRVRVRVRARVRLRGKDRVRVRVRV